MEPELAVSAPYVFAVVSKDCGVFRSAYGARIVWGEEAVGAGMLAARHCPVHQALELHGFQVRELIRRGLIEVKPSTPRLPEPTFSVRGLEVFVCGSMLAAQFAETARMLRCEGQRWCIVESVRSRWTLSPVIGGVDGACWACLATAYGRNHLLDRFLCASDAMPAIVAELPDPVREAMGQLLDDYVRDPSSSRLADHLVRWSAAAAEPSLHRLHRDPQCAACGRFQAAQQDEIVLIPEVRLLRARPAMDLVREWQPLVDPVVGVVGACSDEETLSGLHVALATTDMAGVRAGLPLVLEAVRFRASGKGLDRTEARAAAMGEAIERHSALYTGTETTVVASTRTLPADSWIDPTSCLLFSDWQYRHDPTVPGRFNPAQPRAWSRIWSLSKRRWKLLPTEYLYFRVPVDQPTCPPDSNGMAAGSTLGEAVVHGFLELVERDAVAIWWANGIRPHEWMPLPADRVLIRERVAAHRALNREIRFLDITHDLKVPVVVALSWRTSDGGADQPVFAAAASFDGAQAALKALGEVELRLHMQRRGVRADARVSQWVACARLDDFPQFQALSRATDGRISSEADSTGGDLLRRCLDAAERGGVEILALNLTRPHIRVPVAKVICPGLRHYWRRHAPGRLFDVPVAMGWLAHPLQEAELWEPCPLIDEAIHA